MFGILYLILAFVMGWKLLKIMFPGLENSREVWDFSETGTGIDIFFIKLPASFLTGTLIITWFTYICSSIFSSSSNPMLYGNLISMSSVTLILILTITVKAKKPGMPPKKSFLKVITEFVNNNTLELGYLIFTIVLWSFFMFRSFYISQGTIHTGISVFSDFAPHLAVIRSFSLGSNIPTQYPHFPDGTIRYHFMFQFLAGNLEFLGLPLDWAFNLPSILSMVSFLSLLFALTVIITGKKWAGILTGMLFFFRSSYAIFTFINIKTDSENLLKDILFNKLHIGSTLHEEWGLWAQKVYVNQRHLAFGLGILVFIVIVFLPSLKKMIIALKSAPSKAKSEILSYSVDYELPSVPDKIDDSHIPIYYPSELYQTKQEGSKKYVSILLGNIIREFTASYDAWLGTDIVPSLSAGILLGLAGFWNGAAVIASLSILFIMAIFSKHRLMYLNTAVISFIITLVSSSYFTGNGASAVNPRITLGFLSESNNFTGMYMYLTELLGILPLILLTAAFTSSQKFRKILLYPLIPITVYLVFAFTPYMAMEYRIAICFLVLFSATVSVIYNTKAFPGGSFILMLSFVSPVVLAFFLQLTPDITVNHKYIIIGVILLNIFTSLFLCNLFSSGRLPAIIIASLMTLFLTVTGFVDVITLYNLDRDYINIKIDDPLLVWARDNTGKHEVFLTDKYSLHPLLLSGRMVFYGWPYYAWSAGYDTYNRDSIVKQIYGAAKQDQLYSLVQQNNISYIVVENSIRNSTEFRLNEELIKESFKLVYTNGDLEIYRTYK